MDSTSASLAGAAREALAFLFPVTCVGCGAPDAAVCVACSARMAAQVSRRDLADGFPVWAGTGYEGVARRAIVALKNDQRTDAARALAPVFLGALEAAAAGLAECAPAVVALAALPSTRAAYRRRGYRPVDVVVRRAGLRTEHPLIWRRQPADQIGLGIDAREANLTGALRARRGTDGRYFLLVDDVVTTGGTLREARRALTDAGGIVLGAVVIAATARRLPPASFRSHFAE
ncbi:MAG: phosphoribosyltransferase family protein [Mycetocola sp.]